MAFNVSTGLENQSYNAVRGAIGATYSLQGGWIGIGQGRRCRGND